MSHELYILKGGGFKVRSEKLERVMFLSTMEQAAELLESVGVPPDEVDLGIMEMARNNHNHGNFGIINGHFIFSDVVDAPEQVQ